PWSFAWHTDSHADGKFVCGINTGLAPARCFTGFIIISPHHTRTNFWREPGATGRSRVIHCWPDCIPGWPVCAGNNDTAICGGGDAEGGDGVKYNVATSLWQRFSRKYYAAFDSR